MALAAIEVRGLTKCFGARRALDQLTFDVRAGEVVALVGPNGSGKSTALRTLAGMSVADAGTATVAGIDVSRRREVAALVGAVLSGERAWYRRLSASANLEFFAALRGLGAAAAGAAAAALASVGLAESADVPLSAYSRGMLALLAIARARLGEPPILLLDEPAAGLDAHATARFLGDLARESRQAVVVATHAAHEVTAVADRCLILAHGRVVDELAGRFTERDVAEALERP